VELSVSCGIVPISSSVSKSEQYGTLLQKYATMRTPVWVGHLCRATQGVKFKILLPRSFDPGIYVSSFIDLAVSEPYGFENVSRHHMNVLTDGRTDIDRFYKSSR